MTRTRRALITGSARGVGLALATRLADLGYEVIGTDISEHSPGGPFSETVQADLGSPGDCERILEVVGAVDVIANVAGLLQPRSLTELTLDDFDRAIAVNLRATFQLCRGVAPMMAEQGWGRIINYSSVMARTGGKSSAAYAAAKAGVIALTKAFASEYGPSGVTANTILPAAVDTPLNDFVSAEGKAAISAAIPARRFSTADEQAAPAAFLVSEEAAYINGVSLDVNGGWVMA